MILTLLTLHTTRSEPVFSKFEDLARTRYGQYIGQRFTPYQSGAWFTAVKPYHSGIFPFLAMDLMIHAGKTPCNVFFGHDLLPYSAAEPADIQLDNAQQRAFSNILEEISGPQSGVHFRGFGNRIDIGLNALAALYVDLLSSLTDVERDVIGELRRLQFSRYEDPTAIKTFGLQKRVAHNLGKSPVAVHKSLRSAKYHLLADTAIAMKNMMV